MTKNRGRGALVSTAAGIIVGGAVADALMNSMDDAAFDPAVLGSGGELTRCWGPTTSHALTVAEDVLRGETLAFDVGAAGVGASAIAYAANGWSAPLLVDSAAAAMIGLVTDLIETGCMHAQTALDNNCAVTANTKSYAETVCSALDKGLSPEEVVVVGALAGGAAGLAGIPSRWATSVHGAVGTNRYGLRQCRWLAERLLGVDRTPMADPDRAVHASEVAPRLWLSNIYGVEAFLRARPEAAVVSLCPVTGRFDAHPRRREFAIADAPARTENPLLATVLEEVLDTIDAFGDEGRDVLVHCRYGRSRTGLVLRGWLMRHERLSEPEATAEAEARWSHVSLWNRHFTEVLSQREPGD